MKNKEIMIEVNDVSMRFNLGIEKGFSLKQWFVLHQLCTITLGSVKRC